MAEDGYEARGFSGLSNDLKNKLRQAGRQAEQRTRISSESLPLPELRKQVLHGKEDGSEHTTFGSLTQQDAQIIAAVTEATGANIYVVGSAAADPTKLAEARMRHGDTIVDQDGQLVARPVGDIDIVVDFNEQPDVFRKATAMLREHLIDPKGGSDAGDIMPFGGIESFRSKPLIGFKNGHIIGHTVGTPEYYTVKGGGVKLTSAATGTD